MCKSIQTSIATFAVTVACMGLSVALQPTAPIVFVAIFLVSVSTMQIADALLWWSIKHKNTPLNKFVSMFVIPTILSAQLLVSYYGMRHVFGWSNIYYEAFLWFNVAWLYTSWIRDCLKDGPLTAPNTNGYLAWCNTSYTDGGKLLFLFLLLFPILMAYPNDPIKWAIIITTTVMFIINYTNTAFGSRWCWMSNLVAILVFAIILVRKTISI